MIQTRPLWYRAYTVLSVSYATWVVVLYSTSYTASIPGVMAEFGVTSRPLATLGLTSYLLGLAAGSVVVAPMSEIYGRRVVYLVCLGVFMVLIVPWYVFTSSYRRVCVFEIGVWLCLCGCPFALSSSWAWLREVITNFAAVGWRMGWRSWLWSGSSGKSSLFWIKRTLELTPTRRAVFGAAMISNSPGTIVDIAGHESLALCMSWYSIAPLNGPVTGPLIGGFVYEYLGWRWANWIALILAGVAVVMMALVKETYAPALLKKKAAKMRKETGDDRWWCRHDQRISTLDLLKTNLSRPFVLAATEPILWFFNIWLVPPSSLDPLTLSTP
jgi:MFS family permease